MRSTVGLAALALVGAIEVVAAKCVHRPSSATGSTPVASVSTDTPAVSSTSTPATPISNSQSAVSSSVSIDTSSSSITVQTSTSSNTPGTPAGTTSSWFSSSVATPSGSPSNTGIETNTPPTTTFVSTSGSAGTPTTPLTTATQSDGSVVVKNVVENGNFARNTAGYTTDGDASYDADDGYKGDNSGENGCAKLKATGTGTTTAAAASTSVVTPARRNFKRQVAASDLVSISQGLTGLDVNTDYTLRFYYSIVTGSTTQNDCRLLAFFDDRAIWSAFIMQPDVSPTAYIEVVKQARPSQANPALRFSLRCDIGGSASVLIDSIFLSNQVTPATINQYIIDYGTDGGSIPVSSFTASTTTSVLAPLRTQECVQLGTAGNGLSTAEMASYIRPRSQYDAPWPTPVTFRSCIEHCKNAYQYCGAASWNVNTNECILYKGSLVQIGFATDDASPINFYDGSCLRAPDKYQQCGLMGSAIADNSNPAYIRSASAVQPTPCYQICVGINMGCVSFSWDALSGICHMFRAVREDIGFTPAARSSNTFYNRDCIG